MRIEREIINQFKAWKDAPNRKPILYIDNDTIITDDNTFRQKNTSFSWFIKLYFINLHQIIN